LGASRAGCVEALEHEQRIEPFGRIERTLVIEDARNHPEYVLWSARACIAVPLVGDGRLTAILYVTSATPRAWTAAEISLAEEVAERAADAALRARAQQTIAAELAAMKRLHEVSTRAIGRADLHTLLEEILDATIAMHRAEFGTVQLCDSRSKTLRIASQRGFQEAVVDDACVIALDRRARVVIDDVELEPDFAPSLQLARAAGYRAVQATPLFAGSGEPFGVLSTYFRYRRRLSDGELRLTDVYARLASDAIAKSRAEEAVRESEAKYRTLFTTMDEGFLLAELLRDEHGEAVDILCLEANPTATRVLGVDRTGWRLRDVGPPDNPWFGVFRRVAETGVAERSEEYVPRLDRWLDLYTFRVGEPAHRRVALIFHDITDRKRRERHAESLLEEQTRLRTAAEEASRVKDEFLATVSHEIRTPVTAIAGWAWMLRQGVVKDGAGLSKAIEIIDRNAKAQVRIVEDILDVSASSPASCRSTSSRSISRCSSARPPTRSGTRRSRSGSSSSSRPTGRRTR